MANPPLFGQNYTTPDLVATVTGRATYAEGYRADGMLHVRARYVVVVLDKTLAKDVLQHRPYWFRHRYVPWLASQIPLDGARVLEVGCGTGPSTIQIAERGARLDALDIRRDALEVLQFRAEHHGVADRIETHCSTRPTKERVWPAPTTSSPTPRPSTR